VIVDNCPPFHPDYLRRLDVYKVLRIADGPISAYDRDFAYLHAYDHVLYHSPAYSRDMGMAEKLEYCGAKRLDFWPLALFDVAFDRRKTGRELVMQDRDIDIIFIGGQHVGKLALLATVKRAFGQKFRLHGLTTLKTNLYFNLRYGWPGWVRPLAFDQYVPLYQRSKIGINLHNRGKYTLGSYRLFDLPGNGVMQISDGDEYLNEFFRVDEEIVGYVNSDDLIDKIRYYLAHDDERRAIALRGHERVMKDHRFAHRMRQAGDLIERGVRRLSSKRIHSSSSL
jgi:spore maturation protein CgeB